MKAKISIIECSDKARANQATICFIPGGPGISSATLRSMDILSRSFRLVYVDPPGTGGQDEPETASFGGIVSAIEESLSTLSGPLVLCGHSFGALYGIEIARGGKLQVEALVAIGAPISPEAYAVATDQYFSHMTPKLETAAMEWDRTPSRATLANLLSAYGRLYFSEATVERGSTMLARDRVSSKTFEHVLPILSEGTPKINFVGHTLELSCQKFMIAGEMDLMLPPATLETDARATGCAFHVVEKAGHFVTFDQPEAVARLFENIIIDSKRK